MLKSYRHNDDWEDLGEEPQQPEPWVWEMAIRIYDGWWWDTHFPLVEKIRRSSFERKLTM
jgi:hypothetical protein